MLALTYSVREDHHCQFKNKALHLLLGNLGVHIQHSTPRQPETNGIVERTNQKVKQQLQNWSASSNNWEDLIPPIQLSINLEHNRMMNCSPWTAIHGWALQRMEFLNPVDLENMSIDNYDRKQWCKWHSVRMAKFLESIYKRDVQLKEERYMRLKTSSGGGTSNDEKGNTLIRIGAEVLIEFPQPVGESKKLYQPWKGVYIVVKQLDKNSYLVGLKGSRRRHFVVSSRRMRVINNSEKAIVSGDSNVEEPSNPVNNQPMQCESSELTAKTVDDTEVVKTTKKGGESRHNSTSRALKSGREPKKSTHKMTTRSKRLDN